MTSFNQYLSEQLESLEFRAEYEALDDAFSYIQQSIQNDQSFVSKVSIDDSKGAEA